MSENFGQQLKNDEGEKWERVRHGERISKYLPGLNAIKPKKSAFIDRAIGLSVCLSVGSPVLDHDVRVGAKIQKK